MSLPAAPLIDYISRGLQKPESPKALAAEQILGHPTDRRIGQRIGVSRSCVSRWRRRGTLRLEVAERYADALGVHPAEIWSGYYDAPVDPPTGGRPPKNGGSR